MISWVYFVQVAIVFILGIIGVAIPIICYRISIAADRKHWMEKFPDSEYKPDSFLEWVDGGASMEMAPMLITVIGFGAAFFLFCCGIYGIIDGTSTAIENQHQEPANYSSMILEQKTISQSLAVSDDIVNTGLYQKAIEFNSSLAEMQIKYNDPFYSLNFTGNYDWNDIPFVEVDE